MPRVKIQTVHKGIVCNYKISLPPTTPRALLQRQKLNHFLCIHLGISWINLIVPYRDKERMKGGRCIVPNPAQQSRDVSILSLFFYFSRGNKFKSAVVKLSYHELPHFIFSSKINREELVNKFCLVIMECFYNTL